MEPVHRFVLPLALILLLTILLDQPHLCKGSTAQNILTPGSSLTPTGPTKYLTSGIFAFGFCNVDPSFDDPSQHLLAIWFHFHASDCTNNTVVWFARDPSTNQSVHATERAVLSFVDNKSLSLVDGQTTPLWTPTGESFGSSLALLDSGNLQLIDARGAVSWQSFDHPTHTLLPGQTMNNTHGAYLLSKNTDTDFSPGRFTLVVQNDHNIVLYMRDQDLPAGSRGDAYWASKTLNTSEVPTITLDSSGTLFYNDNSTKGYQHLTEERQSSNFKENYYYYAALDPDGTVRVYSRPKINGGSWDVVSWFPNYDVCSRKTNYGLQGMCGPNAYCKVSSPDNRANCNCSDGYVPVDQQRPYKGCRPNFVPDSCDGKKHSGEFWTVQMTNIDWSDRWIYKNYPNTGTERCRSLCLDDCFCAAVRLNSTNCMFMGMLTAGIYSPETNTDPYYIKVGSSSIPVPFKTSSVRSKLLYTAIGILASTSLISATYLLWQHYLCNKAKRSSLGLITFSYKELARATGGFHLKMMLGKGGFGRVYKGKLSYLQPPYVAVKTLVESNEHSEEGFGNEVGSIGQIHHKNLVRMIGYCKEGAHRVLVFEYMQGGTLADFIFASQRPCWSCLAEAAIGIAKGLEYLHEGCKSKIIHGDIKPDNILFDEKHNPRITDFGISKLLGDQKTLHTVTTVAGTRPYVAPEWFQGEGRVDSKVDVYSFGVVLLEMICCKKASVELDGLSDDSHDRPATQPNLRVWAESIIRSGRSEQLVQGETEALSDMESVERFACVAIWCLQKDPSIRPTMRKVVQMLEGTVGVDALPDPPPRPPSFSAILPTPTSSATLHSSSRAHALQVLVQ